ncbi:MAG: dihydropteroate synthase [Deltaproteobacteria bacterium SG8_13]|nr:MAG: dihydropteroate synthase [Deltaproteobacteria bacterium SG8_13]
MTARKRYNLQWGPHRLELGKRTLVMGVVNITPDSFSDGGLFFSSAAAIAQGEKLARQGADIIDIGGESTRPFSDGVPLEEELGRVIPVIETLARSIPVPISIDTTKSEVARRALKAGAAIINDISSLRHDPEMVRVAAECAVPVILMHMLGSPKTMQVSPSYDDVVSHCGDFLQQCVEDAVAKGLDRSKLIIDPGIGFGKTFEHNLTLLRRLSEFQHFDLPILVGTSRKAFIRDLLKTGGDRAPDPQDPVVETGSQATVVAAAMNGAHIVRVHDVANTSVTLKIIDAIINA